MGEESNRGLSIQNLDRCIFYVMTYYVSDVNYAMDNSSEMYYNHKIRTKRWNNLNDIKL